MTSLRGVYPEEIMIDGLRQHCDDFMPTHIIQSRPETAHALRDYFRVCLPLHLSVRPDALSSTPNAMPYSPKPRGSVAENLALDIAIEVICWVVTAKSRSNRSAAFLTCTKMR